MTTKRFIAFMITLSISCLLFAGCASNGGMVRGPTPALYCNSNECPPNERSAKEPFGPVTLDGGLFVFNIEAILKWSDEINDAKKAATDRLNAKIDQLACGPSCNKLVSSSSTFIVTLNPGNMDTEDKDCQEAFSTTLGASGGGITCELAYLSAMTSINNSIAAAGDVCRSFNPKCGAASVEVSSNEDLKPPYSTKEDERTIWCSVSITAEAIVRCGAGETSINSPAVSGELNATMKCAKPNQCSSPRND